MPRLFFHQLTRSDLFGHADKLNTCMQSMGKGLLVAAVLLVLNVLLLLSGLFADAVELASLSSDNLLFEPLITSAVQFMAQPILCAQLLIGLCWLAFHFFVSTRVGINLRKSAFSFIAATRRQPVCDAHGCRAPPAVASCL